jgi:hypothetical protein
LGSRSRSLAALKRKELSKEDENLLVITTKEKKMSSSNLPESETSGSNFRGRRHGAAQANATVTDYDAELRDWCFHEDGAATVAFGRVFEDRTRRWPDGYAISTSTVVSGAREEGAVIATQNTHYLLSGPPGDYDTMLRLALQQAANAERRIRVAEDERLFDLLPAAWGMDDPTFEQLARLPAGWMWQWRNHYRAPSDDELARVRRLFRFHDAIRLVTYGDYPDYPGWWRRCWTETSFIGKRSPLEAVLQDPAFLDQLEQYLWAQM